jgi:hypothetical protein
MWEGYKHTKKERAAVDAAWFKVCALTGHDYRSERFMKDEARGYGNRNDRIGEQGAKALCVKWYLNGTQKPEALLADYYFIRPAAIWFTGYGASKAAALSIEDEALLTAAVEAHDAAFKRMIDSDR